MKKNQNQKPAFTLVETILAISIIGMIIVTVAQLTQSSVAMGRSAMNQFVALHLAEEGLEIVRNKRDSNWLQNKAWRNGLADGVYENASRVIEITTEEGAIRVKSRVKYQDRGKEKSVELVAEFTDWKKGPI
jgi:type II secretory pathway pseudopilin PulG